MRRNLAIGLSALIVAAIPTILVGNTLWVLMTPWFVQVEYALPGFPADPLGLQGQARSELAVTGVHSIRPDGKGVSLLRDARLPNGEPAFQEREISHMADVRGIVGGFLTLWAIALGCVVAGALGLRRLGRPGSVRHALTGGARLTIAAMALAGVLMLVGFDALFTGFHGILFAGDSWRFADAFTLRRLYPDTFWSVAGAAMALLVALQAAALVAALGLRRRARRHLAPPGLEPT